MRQFALERAAHWKLTDSIAHRKHPESLSLARSWSPERMHLIAAEHALPIVR